MRETIVFLVNHSEILALIFAGVALIKCDRRINALEEKIRQMECISDLDNIERELNDRK